MEWRCQFKSPREELFFHLSFACPGVVDMFRYMSCRYMLPLQPSLCQWHLRGQFTLLTVTFPVTLWHPWTYIFIWGTQESPKRPYTLFGTTGRSQLTLIPTKILIAYSLTKECDLDSNVYSLKFASGSNQYTWGCFKKGISYIRQPSATMKSC